LRQCGSGSRCMSSASPDARLSIDWDAEGAFAVLTRPGAPVEVVRLPDIHRVATEAMQAELAMRGRVVVRPARWPDHSPTPPSARRHLWHGVIAALPDAPGHRAGGLDPIASLDISGLLSIGALLYIALTSGRAEAIVVPMLTSARIGQRVGDLRGSGCSIEG
jgi:hypothetical protein